MKIKTESGSLYELSTDKKQIRCLTKSIGRRARQNEWVTPVQMSVPVVGLPLTVVWSFEGKIPYTLTSRIVEIHDDAN